MLKLTVKDDFPRLVITREAKGDGSLYYGPYSSAKLLRRAVLLLKQIFPLRSCAKLGRKECLEYPIKQCPAPCAGRIDKTVYSETVRELKLFLEGRRRELLEAISAGMKEASSREDFETAAVLRTRLEALGAIRDDAVRYRPSGEVEELRAVLGLAKTPEAIEAFDVSNIAGEAAVGSLIYFYKGNPDKHEYRRFRIKTVSGVDDYAMIREIVRRRYTRTLGERRPLPDLILIDGGRGHLAAACAELEALGLSRIPVVGIAKEFEHLYMKDRKDAVILPKESKALHLLQRIRDEAHRFAISYHKRLMSKRYR
jgi:excinuclease ABC subunit C